ncbi:MAG: thioredoxin family protein [Myxococcales bacterium]|nr:thioredoxin family protein [Myxococcales bacterium]
MLIKLARLFTLFLLVALVAGTTATVWAAPGKVDIRAIHREGPTNLSELFTRELNSAKKQNKRTLVMFTADWCSPCKAIKEHIDSSSYVQKALAKVKILLIDVDEWRGPAHELIAGAVPDKLPMIVSVDSAGKMVRLSMGTDLGLVSDKVVGDNLKRLAEGQAPIIPADYNNPDKQRELIVASAKKDKERVANLPAVTVSNVGQKRLNNGEVEFTFDLHIQNHDSRRRWFAFPVTPGNSVPTVSQVSGWDVVRFDEHVRAYMLKLAGPVEFYVIPLSNYGSVTLKKFVMKAGQGKNKLEIAELDNMTIGGQKAEFDKKVPYSLDIGDANKLTIAKKITNNTKIETPVVKRHEVILK